MTPCLCLRKMDVEFSGCVACESSRTLTVEKPEVASFGALPLVLCHVVAMLLEKPRRRLPVDVHTFAICVEELWFPREESRNAEFDLVVVGDDETTPVASAKTVAEGAAWDLL